VGLKAGVGVAEGVGVELEVGVSVGKSVAVVVGGRVGVADGSGVGLAAGAGSAAAPPPPLTKNPRVPPAANEPKAIQKGSLRRMGLIFARPRQPGNRHFVRAPATT